MSLRFTQILAVLALGALLPLTGCSHDENDAEELTTDLAAALSSHSLEGVPLVNPEAVTAFSEHVDPLIEYGVDVTAGEVTYEMNDATVPLNWSWSIDGHTWQYDTDVALIYEDSQWWATWEPSSFIPGLGAGQLVGIDQTIPDRAEILAADGQVIVTQRPVNRLGIDKTKIDASDVEETASAIARATGVNEESFVASALAAGPKAFVEAITVRPDEVSAWVDPDFDELPGALVVSDMALLAPTRTFAREILGRAGPATAEIIEDSEGEINAGDVVGLSGLQAQFDGDLRGQPTVEIFAVNTSACKDPGECAKEERQVLAELDAGAPKSLGLTLDIDLQIAAEDVLESLGDEDPPASALVAVRPSTGEILAAANGPGNGGFNGATIGQYSPGSTFKVVSVLALLRAGVDPSTVVSCPPTINVDGRDFKNYDAYPESKTGDISLKTAFAQSCNTALIGARDQISGDDLVRAAQSLGLGVERDLGFPADLGHVPAPEGETEAAAAMIGQGKNLVSPLVMAAAAASVQAGETVVPYLIQGQSGADDLAEPLTEAEATVLGDLMRAVVTDGTAALLADVPGTEVRAKTGTAEHGSAESDEPHAWIIGSQGDLAVAVFVESGVGGAETAGPLLKAFLEKAHSD